MKRSTLLSALTVALFALVILSNCADPLERDSNNPVGGSTQITDTVYEIDTVTVIDTLTDIDTIFVIDTLTGIDTVIVIDTLTEIDTIIVIDTLTGIDTIIVIDTLTDIDTIVSIDTIVDIDTLTIIDTILDTVIVVMPDTGIFRPFCAQLASNRQDIVWMFRNAAGNYRLEFTAALEKVQPNQSLTVTIDGVEYQWDPVANPEFIVEQYLNMHATIRIEPNKPPAAGHAIDVCLTVTAL